MKAFGSVIAVVLVFLLAAPATASDFSNSVSRAAAQLASEPAEPEGHINKPMMWTGITLAAGGMVMLSAGLMQGCRDTIFGTRCYAEDVNKPAIVGGLGLAGFGAVLIAVGARHVYPELRQGRVAVKARLEF